MCIGVCFQVDSCVKVSELPELKLQRAVSCHMGARNEMLNHFSRASHWICLRLWWEIDLTCFPAWPHVAFVRLSILERGVGPYLRGCWAGGACQSSARVTTAEGHLTRGRFDSTGERLSFSWAYCETWRCLVTCAKSTSIPIWLATVSPKISSFFTTSL